MKNFVIFALAFASIGTAIPAQAAEYFTSYASISGTSTTGSLYFTTADTLNSKGGYDILSMRGDVNGNLITSLEPNPHQPNLSLSRSGNWNFDNVFYGNGPLLDTDGAVFQTASGLEYNIWSEAGGLYTLASIMPRPGQPGFYDTGPRSKGTLTAATTPPPAPPQTPPTQPTVLTLEDARTYENGVILSQGFAFKSVTCCSFSFGHTADNANNGTQRLIYTLGALDMTTVDGSAFNVTSLDAGVSSYSPAAARYGMLLTGTHSDGSLITTTLDVGNAFQNYTLMGFTDLVSLEFGHPNNSGFYMTIDNIAVSPFSATPEPAAWAMMVFGFGLAGFAGRRSVRRARQFA